MNEWVSEGRYFNDGLLSITLNTRVSHFAASHPPTMSWSRAPTLPSASRRTGGATLRSQVSVGTGENS